MASWVHSISKYTENQYFLSHEAIKEKFKDLPEALTNTAEIAKRCNLELDLDKFFLPDFHLPEGNSAEDHLRDLSKEGLKVKILISD